MSAPPESSTGQSESNAPSRKRSRSNVAEGSVGPTSTGESPERKKAKAERRAQKKADKAKRALRTARKAEADAKAAKEAAEEAEQEANKARMEAEVKQVEEDTRKAEEKQKRMDEKKKAEEDQRRGPAPSEAEGSRPRRVPYVDLTVRKVGGARTSDVRKRGGKALTRRMGEDGWTCVRCMQAEVACEPNDSKSYTVRMIEADADNRSGP